MSQEDVSLKLAQLLDEFSRGEVHCVVLAATTSHESKSIAFGMETNTRKGVAEALLQAGIRRLDDMRIGETGLDETRLDEWPAVPSSGCEGH